MEPAKNRYHVTVELTKAQLLRAQGVVETSRAQILSTAGLIEESRRLLSHATLSSRASNKGGKFRLSLAE